MYNQNPFNMPQNLPYPNYNINQYPENYQYQTPSIDERINNIEKRLNNIEKKLNMQNNDYPNNMHMI